MQIAYGGQGQAWPKILAPLYIGGKPVVPAIRAVMSLMLMNVGKMPFPGTRSQRELKLAPPGFVPIRRTGATKLARSWMSSLFALRPELKMSEGQPSDPERLP